MNEADAGNPPRFDDPESLLGTERHGLANAGVFKRTVTAAPKSTNASCESVSRALKVFANTRRQRAVGSGAASRSSPCFFRLVCRAQRLCKASAISSAYRPSTKMNSIRHRRSPRLAQAWLVPRWITTLPGPTSTSSSSNTRTISPSITIP